MIDVSGDIALGDGQKAGIWALQRLLGRGWASITLVLLYPMVVATVVMSVDNYRAGGVAGIVLVISLALYIVWVYFALPRLVRRLWIKRGAAPKGATRYRVDDEGLHIDSSVRAVVIRWPAVLQLVQGGPYWLIMLPGFAQPVPRRFFTDPAAERAFIGACLEHLSPEARGRSQKAVSFVG